MIARWKHGPHQLTYRQLEYTYRLIATALSKDNPDGSPSRTLSEILDRLLESSVQVLGEPDSSSYAVDWTDHQTLARPLRKQKPPANTHRQASPSPNRPPTSTTPAAPGTTAAARGAVPDPRGTAPPTAPAQNENFFGY